MIISVGPPRLGGPFPQVRGSPLRVMDSQNLLNDAQASTFSPMPLEARFKESDVPGLQDYPAF